MDILDSYYIKKTQNKYGKFFLEFCCMPTQKIKVTNKEIFTTTTTTQCIDCAHGNTFYLNGEGHVSLCDFSGLSWPTRNMKVYHWCLVLFIIFQISTGKKRRHKGTQWWWVSDHFFIFSQHFVHMNTDLQPNLQYITYDIIHMFMGEKI